MAKLVGAKCPNCGAGVKLDPEQDFVTCTFCHTSSFIVTPQKRAKHTAPPANTQVIEIGRVVSGAARIVIGLTVFLMLAGGVVAAAVLIAAQKRTAPPDAAKLLAGALADAADQARSAAQGTSKPDNTVNYTLDARTVPIVMADALGPVIEARELVVYPEYVIFELRSRTFPEQVDRYTLRHGDLGAPAPVTLSSSEKRRLSNLTFSLSDLNWAELGNISRDAVTRAKLPGGAVTHIIVDKPRAGRNSGPMLRVYVGAPREQSVYLEYEPSGRFRRKH